MAKVRVYEIAKHFEIESPSVLKMLGEMGEFVRSASSTLEAPVARRLCDRLQHLRSTGQWPPKTQEPVRRPRAPSPQVAGLSPAELAAMELLGEDPRAFGKSGRPRRSSRPPGQQARPRGRSAPPPTTMHRRGTDYEPWLAEWFDKSQADEWRTGGIYDPKVAEACIQAGLGPQDLAVRVHHRRVGEQIMGGVPPHVVARDLREQRREEQESA